MCQIQRPRRILLNTPMQRLNPRIPRPIRRIAQKLQARAPKPLLLLKNTLIAQRHLQRLVTLGIKPRRLDLRELQDLRPLDVVALDVVWVELLARGIAVEGAKFGASGDAALEDDGAFYFCATRMGGREGGTGKNRSEESLTMHFFRSVFWDDTRIYGVQSTSYGTGHLL